MPRRKGNGEGSVYQRKDGRYEAAAWVLSTRGTRKRLRIYASTRGEAQVSLRAALAQSDRGVPVPLHAWTVGEFLQHWLEDVVRINRRPRTYELYESTIRLHLLPGLGKHSLTRLSVSQVQSFLNAQSDAGKSVRTLHLIRGVLRAALARAVREELLSRNVARLVELPTWQRADIRPWSADEAVQFLQATHDAALHPVYLLLLTYGLRRGEVLGVRWEDVDVAQGQLHIRQQVQRYEGKLHVGPVKTNAGRRDLPLVPMVAEALARRRAALDVVAPGALVFTSRTGQPIEPGNLVRTFKLACVHHGLPPITVHHLRHTTATLLKHVGVPARDAQLILGHAHITTTQQLYQHGDVSAQRQGLARLEQLLLTATGSARSRQEQPSRTQPGADASAFQSVTSGGPGGTRTLDILLKSLICISQDQKVTEAIVLVCDRLTQLVLGAVAVKCSRQDAGDPPEYAEQQQLWAFTRSTRAELRCKRGVP